MASAGGITMAVKSWQLGYDATTGNFVELSTLASVEEKDARKVAFENQVTAIMEQKGLLASQAKDYITNAYDQGTTLDALKHTADQTGTAEQRGDVWGTSGTNKGKSFLKGQEGIKDTGVASNKDLITQLYTEGFGREADAEGLKYWTDELNKEDGMSYSQIAAAFGVSEEAGIRNVYHEEYGRDVDDAGLQFWMLQDDGEAAARAATQHAGTLETQLRESYGTHLGQFSKEKDRLANIKAGGIWTDVQEGGYADLDWSDYKQVKDETGKVVQQGGTDVQKAADYTGLAKFQAAILGKEGYQNVNDPYRSKDGSQVTIREGAAGLEDVRNILAQREKVMHIGATYDKDDMEDGSGIGRMFTLKEMEPYMSTATDLNDLATKLGEEKWALLKKELSKKPDEGDDGWKDPIIGQPIYDPGEDPNQRDTNRNTLSNPYQVPVPPDYEAPDTANVTRQDVDYMPKLDGTVPNRPLRNLDSSYTPAPQQAVRNQGTFVAGSAQGVRRKQSSAARSGRSAMGTKQLARNNMQIKSLNI